MRHPHKNGGFDFYAKLQSNETEIEFHLIMKHMYSGPSILRPPMGPRTGGLILQVVLK